MIRILLIFCFVLSSLIYFNTVELEEKTKQIKRLESDVYFLNKVTEANEKRVEKLKNQLDSLTSKQLTITAYSPEKSQTDSTPFTTACMTKVKNGIVAVSQDLFNAGWSCGKKIFIKGIGIKTIQDVMHKRKKDQIDIFYFKTSEAKEFGVQKNIVVNLVY